MTRNERAMAVTVVVTYFTFTAAVVIALGAKTGLFIAALSLAVGAITALLDELRPWQHWFARRERRLEGIQRRVERGVTAPPRGWDGKPVNSRRYG